jgi:hypothetical protein
MTNITNFSSFGWNWVSDGCSIVAYKNKSELKMRIPMRCLLSGSTSGITFESQPGIPSLNTIATKVSKIPTAAFSTLPLRSILMHLNTSL